MQVKGGCGLEHGPTHIAVGTQQQTGRTTYHSAHIGHDICGIPEVHLGWGGMGMTGNCVYSACSILRHEDNTVMNPDHSGKVWQVSH